jgi:hypothetical protein
MECPMPTAAKETASRSRRQARVGIDSSLAEVSYLGVNHGRAWHDRAFSPASA